MDVTFPSQIGARRYSDTGGNPSLGPYAGKVESWAKVSRAVNERTNALGAVEFAVSIVDLDSDLAKIAGPYRGIVRGSPVLIRLPSSNLQNTATWFTAFSGVLNTLVMSSPGRYSLAVRPNDATIISGYILPPLISSAVYPHADPSSVNQYMPIIYGKHDSSSLSKKGQVPCLLVDNTAGMHLVCVGKAAAVTGIYLNGTLQTSGASTIYSIDGGIQVTKVQVTGANSPNTVSVDVQGYEPVGDGSGTVITNPVLQLRHLIENFAYSRYTQGPWVVVGSTAAPLDPTYFGIGAQFATDMGYEGSRRYAPATVAGQPPQPTQLLQAINEWADNEVYKIFWRNNGLMAVRPLDYRVLVADSIYLGEPNWMHWERDELAPFLSLPWDVVNIMSENQVASEYDSNAGQYKQTYDMIDPDAAVTIPRQKSLPWSAARATGL